MQPNFGDRQVFNKHVGDVDVQGRRIKRQFSYYPKAEGGPVLVPEGGAVGEQAMQAESLTPEGDVIITKDTIEQPFESWWTMTLKERTIFDEIAAGTRNPYPTPDGLPPENDQADQSQEQQQEQPQHEDQPFGSSLPPVTNIGPNGEDIPPFEQQHAPGMIPIDIASFSEMQRQLIIGQIEPLVELQDMVIQTQAILLSELLEPSSPHHRIMEMWMSKLETMKANNTNGQAAEPEDN